ncbi:flavodoxin family protein [Limisalsivibrio acetivorans]|uniref:flavodoxin family protein n=1 Tax=Limisalsivibrio acetivorans TaxID=1304888 RepID=UPI0003B31E53|nr:flavodoxin family protein [Limisalsivibrio acetivorans]
MTVPANITAITASPRKGGNSDILTEYFCSGAKTDRLIRLADYDFSPCVGCEMCRKTGKCSRFDDGMQEIYPRIIESKGLFLISPVHNYNVTAWMKAFIDRLYCFYEFEEPRPGPWRSKLAGEGRKAVVAAVCEQADKKDMGFTLEAMSMPLEALGYEIIAESPVLNTFYKGRIADNSEALQRFEDLGRKLREAVT